MCERWAWSFRLSLRVLSCSVPDGSGCQFVVGPWLLGRTVFGSGRGFDNDTCETIIACAPSLHAPRAGTWLTVYRAPQVEFQHASQKVGKIDDKNEDFSGSVNSFHSGPIFRPSSGKELSRNVGVMSVYAF